MCWRGPGERSVALFRFSPATHAYGRRATDSGWPAELLEELTDGQRAVPSAGFRTFGLTESDFFSAGNWYTRSSANTDKC